MFSMKRYGAENGDLFIYVCKEYLPGRRGFVKALNESANWKWSKQGTNGRKRPSHYRKAEIDSHLQSSRTPTTSISDYNQHTRSPNFRAS